MKRLVTILASVLAVGCGASDEPLLRELQPMDTSSIVCGCSFNESIPDTTEGSYGSGPEILVLDINGDPANARINLGADNVRLLSEQLSLYDCEAEGVWASTWRSEAVVLKVELVPSSPGAEACWFTGTATAAVASRESSTAIKGACGC